MIGFPLTPAYIRPPATARAAVPATASAGITTDDSAFVEVVRFPVRARLDTCAPFTYSRTVAPSYVTARCVHVFTATAAVPYVSVVVPPNVPPPAGRFAFVDVPDR